MVWMHYAAQHWVQATDIKSAIERLSNALFALSNEAYHATNYNMDICFNEDEIRKCLENAAKYDVGVNMCNKYMYGMLNLDEFCQKMIEVELKNFLYDLQEYLPLETIEKFKLHVNNENNETDNI